MERTMSVEEKIRRAEEIYQRRKRKNDRTVATLNVNNKKDFKLLKKIFIQILICTAIYFTIYLVKINNYVFSEDFINKLDEIISKDIDFNNIYSSIKEYISGMNGNEEILPSNEGIGGAEEDIENEDSNLQEEINQVQELSQEEQDIENIKKTTTFIKPLEGNISSRYGRRESATGAVPKNHTGTDIAANIGTKIIASTDGEVVLASEEGDYRKTFENSNWRS